jgi:hypothetical protein
MARWRMPLSALRAGLIVGALVGSAVLGVGTSPALAQGAPPTAPSPTLTPDPAPTPLPEADPMPAPAPPPPPPPEPVSAPAPEPVPPPPPEPVASAPPPAAVAPSPSTTSPPAPAALTAKRKPEATPRPPAAGSSARTPSNQSTSDKPVAREPAAANSTFRPATTQPDSGLARSPFLALFLTAAAALTLLSIVPFTALERLLDLDRHWRTERLAIFVDGHRLNLAVAGAATLLLGLVLAIPPVTG